MKSSYIIRIDDVSPGMNWDNFNRIEKMVDKYGIKPLIGVVPNNKDTKLDQYGKIGDFWLKIKELENKGWTIAQHGYQHLYVTKNSGIIGLNNYSEFAGLSYNEQLEKITKGKEILEKNLQIKIKWWMAPAHSFDKNTCIILKKLGFEYITDGIALFPFEKYGLKWLPQQLWRPIKLPFGIWTICLHPNTMKNNDLINIESFLKNNIFQDVIGDLRFGNNIIKFIFNFIFMISFNLLLILKKCLFKKA